MNHIATKAHIKKQLKIRYLYRHRLTILIEITSLVG
jgi:hypothetical protein